MIVRRGRATTSGASRAPVADWESLTHTTTESVPVPGTLLRAAVVVGDGMPVRS
ncbi:hypothetical protein KCV87_32015 [Actinosynnema pretiosum subsp. pretiosum]|uniref:Uncharacterized protein n=1 Tax=Actinosynnema pretiosum subsp. pretiosum TaxID=103721 RepID=A0AA45R3K4_9PSEU|nr:hypothetical protein APASM_4734 [Actinosynnema pretiosum subsp. pretiosum]QUF03931.1 hypothetical protein KCV87_32015 [Actinosynnema pretiosum subsp. pretiosum]